MHPKSTLPDACVTCGQWLLPAGPTRSFPLEIRIWKHIARRGPDDCWFWTGSLDHGGYGQINDGRGRIRKAHQVVLEIVLARPLAPGEWGLHRCDNPPCCNPAHLYAGTVQDNVRDMWARGRGYTIGRRPGQLNGNATLTDAQAREILAALSDNPPRGTKARLAREYGVTKSIITRIENGRMWGHVRHRPA